ncbi:hypothetical protein [Nocardioides speluncae]|uniref:hypothetical protein n=1 Tax=Nocardioides speluncae TaxID=2670337 RepID=UPI000D68A644|nr:hypothetical protein [Nocardioides speluncae]
MTDQQTDPFEEFTGDRAGAVQLRRSLTVLRDKYAGTPLGHQLQLTLEGRMTMRDLAGDPEFASLAQAGMREYAEQWAAMSPEEKQALVRESEAAERAANEELGDP